MVNRCAWALMCLCLTTTACGSRPALDAKTAAAPLAMVQDDAYPTAQLAADLQDVLTSRPAGPLSGRALGNSQNFDLWTPDKIDSLYRGILFAHDNFYAELPLVAFARLVLSEGAQESTGNFNLGVRPVDFSDFASQGFIQVTPGSVVLDYKNYGLPLGDAQGVILDPSRAEAFDLSDLATSLAIWSWYTKNSLAFGVSFNEWIHRDDWHIPVGGVTRDYGNALFTWLAGPHNDRHVDAKGFDDYYNRVGDYYVQSGFGTYDSFAALMATPLNDDVVGVQGEPTSPASPAPDPVPTPSPTPEPPSIPAPTPPPVPPTVPTPTPTAAPPASACACEVTVSISPSWPAEGVFASSVSLSIVNTGARPITPPWDLDLMGDQFTALDGAWNWLPRFAGNGRVHGQAVEPWEVLMPYRHSTVLVGATLLSRTQNFMPETVLLNGQPCSLVAGANL